MTTVFGVDSVPMMTRPRYPWRLRLASSFALAVCMLTGCTEEHDIPAAKTEVVSAYDQTLDAAASPKQVAYVLLRTLADDVRAAQAHQHEAQEQAIEQAFSLAAFDEIEKRVLNVKNAMSKSSSLWGDRYKQIYEVVYRWAPIVAHYIDSFDQDFASASAKMTMRETHEGAIAHVYYPVVHDPNETDSEKIQSAIVHIELARQAASSGDEKYWRVAKVTFAGQTELNLPDNPVAPTASAPADTES